MRKSNGLMLSRLNLAFPGVSCPYVLEVLGIGRLRVCGKTLLSNVNPVDIVLGLHVDLDPAILIVGVPVSADVVVDYPIVAIGALIAG